MPDSPHEVLASMGNYVFDADALVEAVTRDADLEGSKHDMGGDIVPAFVDEKNAGVYDFKDNDVPGSTDRDRGYWRDVGTMESYHAAHMDLVSVLPVFNLYNYAWPMYTVLRPAPTGEAGPRQGGRTGPGVRRGALARCRGDRRQRQSVGPLALCARGDRGRGHRLGPARRRAGRPGSGGPQRDRGQGSGHPRRWRSSVSTPTPISRADSRCTTGSP